MIKTRKILIFNIRDRNRRFRTDPEKVGCMEDKRKGSPQGESLSYVKKAAP